jgi:hypothetical protein
MDSQVITAQEPWALKKEFASTYLETNNDGVKGETPGLMPVMPYNYCSNTGIHNRPVCAGYKHVAKMKGTRTVYRTVKGKPLEKWIAICELMQCVCVCACVTESFNEFLSVSVSKHHIKDNISVFYISYFLYLYTYPASSNRMKVQAFKIFTRR